MDVPEAVDVGVVLKLLMLAMCYSQSSGGGSLPEAAEACGVDATAKLCGAPIAVEAGECDGSTVCEQLGAASFPPAGTCACCEYSSRRSTSALCSCFLGIDLLAG